MLEAVPKRLNKDPKKEVKHYVTLGRVAITLASALGTLLMRPREAHGVSTYGRGDRNFPATVK